VSDFGLLQAGLANPGLCPSFESEIDLRPWFCAALAVAFLAQSGGAKIVVARIAVVSRLPGPDGGWILPARSCDPPAVRGASDGVMASISQAAALRLA